ncbi:hypothetical protein [Bradyrhizobium sp. Rc2d]|uniref:hypothetical protein n=1 Tax=Bradyrhizobium sp. Rc2d TaxID=1855321 RepID=UPI001FCDD863|nr:hypothetical protein [Bradyrhizobium sp. Rc2d]
MVMSELIHSVDRPNQENQFYHLQLRHIDVEDGWGQPREAISRMKKFVFVTASALALATAAVPTFVAKVAAQPVTAKVQVADTSYPQCADDPLDGICDLFFCLTDPSCVHH